MKNLKCLQHCVNGHNNSKTQNEMMDRARRDGGLVYVNHDLHHYLYALVGDAHDAAVELIDAFITNDDIAEHVTATAADYIHTAPAAIINDIDRMIADTRRSWAEEQAERDAE